MDVDITNYAPTTHKDGGKDWSARKFKYFSQRRRVGGLDWKMWKSTQQADVAPKDKTEMKVQTEKSRTLLCNLYQQDKTKDKVDKDKIKAKTGLV